MKLEAFLIVLLITGLGLVGAGFAGLPSPDSFKSQIEISKIGEPNISDIENPLDIKIPEPVEPDLPPGVTIKKVELQPGSSLYALLDSEGVDRVQIAYAVGEVDSVYNLRKLRPGKEIELQFSDGEEKEDGTKRKNIEYIKFQPDFEKIVELNALGDNGFVAKLTRLEYETKRLRATGEITSSLYEATLKEGMTDNVTLQLIAALSYAIDFQRDIHEGDSFDILYEVLLDENGNVLKGKRPVYIKMQLGKKKPIEIFVVENEDNTLGYFYANGESLKRGLLRTPINGARLSSRYGMRKHPILGYSKMHTGVDFAAPKGTPIYAAGNGVIERIGWVGGYGKYIKVKHNETYSTAYAHMSRYASGMKKGSRVKQGQVIAYVGSTGRSTGPHLHYEVIKNGKQINPQNAKFKVVDKLKGDKLKAFESEKKAIMASLENTPGTSQTASSEQ